MQVELLCRCLTLLGLWPYTILLSAHMMTYAFSSRVQNNAVDCRGAGGRALSSCEPASSNTRLSSSAAVWSQQ